MNTPVRAVSAISPAAQPLARSTVATRQPPVLGPALAAPAVAETAAFTAGQILQVRVLSTAPQLALAVLARSDATAEAALTPLAGSDAGAQDTAALQPDQAAMRHLARSRIDAPVLAAAWRAQVLSRLGQRASVPAVAAPITATPEAAMLSTALRPNASESRLLLPTPSLQLYAWPEMPLWLRVLGPLGAAAARQRLRARLRLALALPRLGPLVLEVDVQDDAVGLVLCAHDEGTLAALRTVSAPLAAALARAGLRLARCQVVVRPQDGDKAMRDEGWHGVATQAAVPEPLFRAATELLAVLVSPSFPPR